MINNSPSFSSPSGAHTFSAPSSSPQPPSWANADAHQQIGMSHNLLEHSFSADHTNSVAFQPMFNNPFPASFQSNAGVPSLGAPAPMLVQQPLYVAQELNSFWKPDSNPAQLVKMEPGNDMFAARDFVAYRGSQPMMGSMSLPSYATHAPDRRFTFSDAESIGSVASPSSTSEASSRPASAKRGSKRKTMLDASLDSPAAAGTPQASDAVKGSKKVSKQASQRRPPPSASHVTESGKPFPVIDTSAKHSSLFVPPDTSGLTKREARLVKNRAAAFLSRQRKREQFEEMEIKCKGISMLVWRMWEAIAGPDADLERIDSTSLAAVLANEEPMARLCLEEVISKKGASIAPTADDAEGTPAPEFATNPSTAAPAPNAQKDAQAAAIASAELEQARCDLAASMQRESELLAQLDALHTSVATAQASMSTSAIPVNGFEAMDANVAAMPFKGVQGAELPLFVPESPLSKFTLGDAPCSAMMLDASHSAGFDLSKTPTLAMFSENALRNRSAQQYTNSGSKVAAPGMGLGLDYRFPCASAPSSPSTASSSSMESNQSRANSLISQHSASSGKAPSTLASVLLLAGMSLMGVGPSAEELAATEASTSDSTAAANTSSREQARTCRRSFANAKAPARAASTHAAGQPSSHLSDDDLLVEMGLASASLSEAEDGDEEAGHGASIIQPAAGAMTVSCT
ncbi:hypothetical protein EX895_002364 [Sporisorium graminicola]|uniref:BZIP domain-containing protein n=1 Tax=Sporisorium graminicola TaxID=280036 RepID=A0A4U7KVV7_9BASI|nr:hypothetical protein EX895_002364 [Sporisorium graminicola]TKY88733.1 hypothetical protein EX895_002364 [Sporisorium graminicola]